MSSLHLLAHWHSSKHGLNPQNFRANHRIRLVFPHPLLCTELCLIFAGVKADEFAYTLSSVLRSGRLFSVPRWRGVVLGQHVQYLSAKNRDGVWPEWGPSLSSITPPSKSKPEINVVMFQVILERYCGSFRERAYLCHAQCTMQSEVLDCLG